MVVTSKVFLDERRQKADNTYPLKIRITVDRKHKEVSLSIYLLKEQWDSANNRVKPNHPNAKLITMKINKELNDIQEKALKFETSERVYVADDLTTTDRNISKFTFLEFANREIENLKRAGRVGNAKAYQDATNRLIRFVGRKSIRFENIDYRLLEDFCSTMQADGMKTNAIAVYMRELRAIYNKAIKTGIVEHKYYPFRDYKIKTAKTINRRLSAEELKQIFAVKSKHGTTQWHSLNYFMLSFCLIGINLTDLFLLKPENIIRNRIVFSRSKTKKIYSIALNDVAKRILKEYYNPDNKAYYLLPILDEGDTPSTIKKKAQQAIKTTNKYIGRIAASCGINGEITSYYARYSWANICKSLGYSKDLIAEALGHSYGNAVTGIYLDNYSNEIIDAANAKIIEAVFG
jgi:integrase/recombinase XerD